MTPTNFFIYLKDMNQSIPVEKENMLSYYGPLRSFMKRQKYAGKCMCPAKKALLCTGCCYECDFYVEKDSIMDNEIMDDTLEPSYTRTDELDMQIAVRNIVSTLSEREKAFCYGMLRGLNNKELMDVIGYEGTEEQFYTYKRRILIRLRKPFLDVYKEFFPDSKYFEFHPELL